MGSLGSLAWNLSPAFRAKESATSPVQPRDLWCAEPRVSMATICS